MGLNFKGKPDDLKAKLLAVGVSGEWSESNGNHVVRLPDGGVLNWAPSKGTISCQGPAHAKHALEARVAEVLGGTSAPATSGSSPSADTPERCPPSDRPGFQVSISVDDVR